MEQWKKVTWTDESSFLLHYANGRARVLLLPGEVMLQDHCGTTTSRWRECDALSMFCWKHWIRSFVWTWIWHVAPKHCVRPGTLFMTTMLTGGSVLFQQDNAIWLPHCTHCSGTTHYHPKASYTHFCQSLDIQRTWQPLASNETLRLW